MSFFPIHPLIKPLADIHHPVGEFLEGLVDEGVGHVLVVGVSHGAGDGSEGVGIGDNVLHRLGHQIMATYEAEDGDAVVLVQDSQRAQHLAQRRTAGGHVVDDQHVLLAYRLA